jgi:TIR domain
LTNDEIIKIQHRIYDLRATQALQINPLFIPYSHADKPFVDKMDTALTKKGVRFWRDIHDATAGRLETQIDRAIRQIPTVLLVLSKNSLKSDWVEHEVRTARELEKELGRDALCPVALDDSWKSSPWPKRIMEQLKEKHVLDFSKWENDSVFEEQLGKLLNGLDLFYMKDGHR